MLDGGVSGGIKNALANGFINIYSGIQPSSADSGATGTILATVTVDGDGVTGLNFGSADAGAISKAAEVWRFTGLSAGNASWFRFYEAADTPSATSSTAKRIDGSLGTAGADITLSNVNIAVGNSTTIDSFTITLPSN
jgi:hypothetical protein